MITIDQQGCQTFSLLYSVAEIFCAIITVCQKRILYHCFLILRTFWRKDSNNIPIIQICVTHFCIIINNDKDYANRSEYPNNSLFFFSELLRGTIKEVIEFVGSGSRIFTYRQEGDVRRYMSGQSDKEKAAETVYNASLPFLNREECERVKGQLSYIVQDMKEERQQSRSRGFHM
jgi:hypothetical protein